MPVNLQRLPLRRVHTVLAEFFFGANLVEGQPTCFNAVTGVGDAAIFENFLHLTVFAEGPVQRDEGKIDILRELEIFILDIDIHDLGA